MAIIVLATFAAIHPVNVATAQSLIGFELLMRDSKGEFRSELAFLPMADRVLVKSRSFTGYACDKNEGLNVRYGETIQARNQSAAFTASLNRAGSDYRMHVSQVIRHSNGFRGTLVQELDARIVGSQCSVLDYRTAFRDDSNDESRALVPQSQLKWVYLCRAVPLQTFEKMNCFEAPTIKSPG